MLALAHHYDELLTSTAGTFRARVYGQAQEDEMWGGWIVFFPVDGGSPIATDRETTQSSLANLSYWASGLTHLYLHGALDRALTLQPEVQLAKQLEQLERIQETAAARAEALEAAAEAAKLESTIAEAARDRTEDRFLSTVAGAAEIEAAAHERAAEVARATGEAADQALRSRKRSKGAKSSSKKK
jgi:hypothetical protein